MDVRSYWVSKLPTVRKQSPATGKLVEHLLINDSSVARHVLIEMTRIKENELSTASETTSTDKGLIEKAKNSLKRIFSKASKDASQNKSPSEIVDQIATAVEDVRNENNINSKLYIAEAKNYDNLFRRYKYLFDNSGFSSFWKQANILQKVSSVALTSLSIAIAIYFGVLIYKRFRDKGHKIVGIILGVLAGLILQTAVATIMNGLYSLVVYLINLFKKMHK